MSTALHLRSSSIPLDAGHCMSIGGCDDPSSEKSHGLLIQNLPHSASSKHAQTLGVFPVQSSCHSLQQISDMQRPASAQRFGVRQNGSGASRSQRTHLQEVGKPRESCGRNQTCGSPSGHQPFMLRSSVVSASEVAIAYPGQKIICHCPVSVWPMNELGIDKRAGVFGSVGAHHARI